MNILKDLINQIKRQTELVERLRSQCEKTTSGISENECQNNSLSKKDDVYARLMDESGKLAGLRNKRDVMIYGTVFSDSRQWLILDKKYMMEYTWKQIAEDLNLSERRVRELSDEAIKLLNV